MDDIDRTFDALKRMSYKGMMSKVNGLNRHEMIRVLEENKWTIKEFQEETMRRRNWSDVRNGRHR